MKLFKKLNQSGVAHLAVLAVVVVGLAAVGTYMLVASHAATCVDYTYGKGNSGTCVKYIQQLVNYDLYTTSTGSYISTDGIYGSITKSTVQKYQYKRGLSTDGIVGPLTWKALCQPHVTNEPSWWYSAWNNAGCSKFGSTW